MELVFVMLEYTPYAPIAQACTLEAQCMASNIREVYGHRLLVGHCADHPSCWLNADPALTPFFCPSDP